MSTLRACLQLLFVAVPTLWLGVLQVDRPLDIENLSMKSVGTSEARAMQQRLAEFGDEHTVLLLYEALDRAGKLAEPAGLRTTLLRLPGVKAVRPIPLPNEPSTGGAEALMYAVDVVAAADGSYAERVLRVVASASSDIAPTPRLYVTGQPVAEIAIAEAVARERRWIPLLIVGALGTLFLLAYRSLAAALAVLLPALAGIAWVSGCAALCGLRVDPVNALQDPVLLTVGVATSVHLVEAFLRQRARGVHAEQAVRRSTRALLLPTVLTAATTVAGFASLACASMPAVQRFGLLVAGGVAATAVLTFAIVPPWLVLFAGSARLAELRPPRAPSLTLSRWLACWTRARTRWIGGVAAVATLLAGAACLRTQIDTDPLLILPAQHPVRVATARVAKHLGGTATFDLLLPAEPKASLQTALALVQLETQLAQLPGVVALAGLPRTAPSGARLQRVLLAPGSTAERERLFQASEHAAHELGFTNAVATGPSVQVARDSEHLVRGQLTGFLATLAFLWLVMALGLRSAWLGGLGLLPNVLPLLLIYGTLASVGRPLSVASAMIGSVMLGLIVDNSIHLLHQYRSARSRGRGRTSALARAAHGTGRAILLGSTVLAVGFGTGLTGSLSTTREFGMLAAATIVLATAANLLLLPALLQLPRRGDARPARGTR